MIQIPSIPSNNTPTISIPIAPLQPNNISDVCEVIYLEPKVFKVFPILDFTLLCCSLLFLTLLVLKLRSSISRLRYSGSLLRTFFYSSVWFVVLYNIFRIAVSNSINGLSHDFISSFWLIARSINLLLEISIIVFLFNAQQTNIVKLITRISTMSFGIAIIFALLQGICLWVINMDLFSYSKESCLFWIPISAISLVCYLTIIILPFCSRLKHKMPARIQFYLYIAFLILLNALRLTGSIVIYIGNDMGFCFIDLSLLFYYAGFAPLLYVTFLWDFFHTKTRTLHSDIQSEYDNHSTEYETIN